MRLHCFRLFRFRIGIWAWTLTTHQVLPAVLEVSIKSNMRENLILRWHYLKETADQFVRRTRTSHGDDSKGVSIQLDEETVVEAFRGIVRLIPSSPDAAGKFVVWEELAAYLHMALAQTLPVRSTLDAEMLGSDWVYDPSANHVMNASSPDIGLFVLQSPGRNLWPVLADSLSKAWYQGLIPSVRVHVLVHHVADWKKSAWEDILGAEAQKLLRGFHWCQGVQRSPRLGGSWDSYAQKMHTIVQILDYVGYKYMASFDDDVALPPSALAAVLNAGSVAERLGCGVVSPLLQNGIPSVELFARLFFSEAQVKELYACFAQSSADFVGVQYPMLEPLPSPWDPVKWYDRVSKLEDDFKGLHPARGNDTCMSTSLEHALQVLPREWPLWHDSVDHRLLTDREVDYPYFCNNAYVMSARNYRDAILRPEYASKTDADEIPINLLLKAEDLAMCFVDRSFGLHPAYNQNPLRHLMEYSLLRALIPFMNLVTARVIMDEFAKGDVINVQGATMLTRGTIGGVWHGYSASN